MSGDETIERRRESNGMPRLRIVAPAAPAPPVRMRPGGAPKPRVLAALRRRVEAIERPRLAGTGATALSLGVAAIDRALPDNGLRPAGLHEFLGTGGALALVAALAGRRLAQGAAGPVLWCLERGLPYPPGLAAFGLGPERLILARAREGRDVLWAMEEALGSGRAALVVGETRRLDWTASRRLQLAAETSATPALLLNDGADAGAAAAGALTRWRVASAPSGPAAHGPGIGAPRLALELLRARGATPGAWLIEWDHATHTFSLVTLLVDRESEPAATPNRRARA